jgi:hypothetical protein
MADQRQALDALPPLAGQPGAASGDSRLGALRAVVLEHFRPSRKGSNSICLSASWPT